MKIKLGIFQFHLVNDRKQPVRRSNGQVARKIPVKSQGRVIYYEYL